MARKNVFGCADILLPKKDFGKWSVIACDQFTSQPEYWEKAKNETEGYSSTLNLILPEVYLSEDNSDAVGTINSNMSEYLNSGIFNEYKDGMIFVERTLPNGSIRYGIVGAIDLEAYDYGKGSTSAVRATEGTVIERIPPRVAIRREAPLELPHIMVLIDDIMNTVIEPLIKEEKQLVYDTDLMLGGGHIKGYLLSTKQIDNVNSALSELGEKIDENGVFFAVGDGNHSLATAKECYRIAPNDNNRYALCEIVNIHCPALEFEPIYRLVTDVDKNELKSVVKTQLCAGAKKGSVVFADEEIEFFYDGLSAAAVQGFVDAYISSHPKTKVDYIHGEDYLRELSKKENCAGFIFDGMDKSELFPYVSEFGALPRKTFSMGEAESKRYYMEARKIK